MKDDLISRQAAIDALRTHERKASKVWLENQLDIEWNNAIDVCCYDLADVPSAQPEIIGCEDCKFADEKPIADGRYWCTRNGSFMYYCSDAERRNNG